MFNFKNSNLQLTEEDLKTAEEGGGGGSKFMGPGVHAVKVISAEHYAGKIGSIYATDPTWVKMKVVFENAAGETKDRIVLIPTSKLTYTSKDGKETPFVFVLFKQFCAGLGIEISVDAAVLTKVMNKYFTNPKKLIGLTADIKVAYKGPYKQYVSKDKYMLFNVKGEMIDGETYTKDDADKVAATKGLTLTFPEIVEFVSKLKDTPKEEAPVAEDAEKW